VAGLAETFSAGAFVERALPVIEDIAGRGFTPVLCGGSGLYYKALIDGLGSSSPSDPGLRSELESTPLPELIDELRAQDPEWLLRIDVRNRRRVVRAVEQARSSGGLAGRCRALWGGKERGPVSGFYALKRGPDDLRRRIDARVEWMLGNGWIEETRRLLAEGLEQNRTAMQAIGYRQIVEFLRGAQALPATSASIKQRTWQFARRQRNWFERQLPARAMAVQPGEPAAETAQQILVLWREAEQAGGKDRTIE
jgi:tRNA dimethylallyltransferase